MEGFLLKMNQAICNFIYQQWGCSDPFCSVEFSEDQWDILSARAYEDKKRTLILDKKWPFCMRLVGQSGSGKTSQLLPAVKAMFDAQQLSYISLAVRDFVDYHPHLQKIKQLYGEALVREKTNAFALILLTLVFERCIKDGYPLLFEVTLLAPTYERFIHTLLEQYKYRCDYQVLAVSKALSDQWIADRCRATQRVVTNRSAKFFYEILESAFLSLRTFTLKNRVFVWDCFHLSPILSNLRDEKLWEIIVNARCCAGLARLELEESVRAKITFLKNFYATHEF